MDLQFPPTRANFVIGGSAICISRGDGHFDPDPKILVV